MHLSDTKKPIQIVSIVVSVVCIITLFLPWLTIGIKSGQHGTIGGYTVINQLVSAYEGSNLKEVARDFFLEAQQELELPASARKQLLQQAKSIDSLLNILKSNHLSVFTLIRASNIVTSFLSFVDKFIPDFLGDFSEIRTATTAVTVIGIIFMLLITASAGYNIYAAVTGKKTMLYLLPALYAVGLVAGLVSVSKVNGALNQAAGGLGGLALSFMGIDNLNVLHMSIIPILVFVLACAAAGLPVFLKSGAISEDSVARLSDSLRDSAGFVKSRASDYYKKASMSIADKKVEHRQAKDGSRGLSDEKHPASRYPIPADEEVVPEGTGWKCPRCGKTNRFRYKFCPRCGLKYIAPDSDVKPAAPTPGRIKKSAPASPIPAPAPKEDLDTVVDVKPEEVFPVDLNPKDDPFVAIPVSKAPIESSDTPRTTGGLRKGPRHKSEEPPVPVTEDGIPKGFFTPPEL